MSVQRYRLPLLSESPVPSHVEAKLPQPVRWYVLAEDYDDLKRLYDDAVRRFSELRRAAGMGRSA